MSQDNPGKHCGWRGRNSAVRRLETEDGHRSGALVRKSLLLDEVTSAVDTGMLRLRRFTKIKSEMS